MKIFKTMWDSMMQSYSCIMGVSINLIWLVLLILARLFPVPHDQLLPPGWMIVMMLFANILVPIGLGLAVYDCIKGKWLLAGLGAALCLSWQVGAFIYSMWRMMTVEPS